MHNAKGHYCRVCGDFKLDKWFCGNIGFSYHICKKCKAESETFSLEHMSVLSILDDYQNNRLLIRDNPSHYLSTHRLLKIKKRFGTIFEMTSYEMSACGLLWDKIIIFYWLNYGHFPKKSDLTPLIVRFRDVILRDLLFDLKINGELQDCLYRWTKSIEQRIKRIHKLGKATHLTQQPVEDGENGDCGD